MSSDDPDYTQCSLDELYEIRRSIDAVTYPERAKTVELLIRDRERRPIPAPQSPMHDEPAAGPGTLAWIGIIFGGGIAAIVVLFGLVLLWASIAETNYESTAVPYLEAAIADIATWDAALMRKHLDTDVDTDDLDEMVAYMSQLGELKTLGEPQFQQVSANASTETGKLKLILYQVPAVFDAGAATITVAVRDQDGDFSIYNFNVSSKVFMKPGT